MLPAANPRQSFRNFRAFIELIQDPDVVVLHDAETQTEPQINASSAPITLQLPPEVWRHIFRYLSVVQLKKVRQVCCNWQQIVDSNQRFLDQMVLRFPIGKTMDENFQLESKMQIPNVAIEQARIISYCSNYPESKQWWTLLSKRLTCLSLTETKICVFELWRMQQQTPQLQELSLMNISFPSYDLTRIVKCNTLRHMRKFSVFSLRYEVIFHFFGEAFPRLKQFKCDNPLDDQDDNEELVRYLKTAQNPLEAIEITGTDAILDTLNNLKKLKLKEVVLLSVDSPLKLLQLVRMHSTITVLIIQYCTLSNTEIAEIGRTLPHLQSFNSSIASDLNNCWKTTFIHAMPKLQWLSVNNIEHNYPIARFDHDDHECLRALQLYNLQINVPGHLLKFTCNIFDISLVDVKFKSWSDMFDSFQYDMVWSLKLESIKVLNPTENLVCRFRNLRCLELLSLSMDQSLLQTIFELTLDSPATVAPPLCCHTACSGHQSRPGPVCGVRERVFQMPTSVTIGRRPVTCQSTFCRTAALSHQPGGQRIMLTRDARTTALWKTPTLPPQSRHRSAATPLVPAIKVVPALCAASEKGSSKCQSQARIRTPSLSKRFLMLLNLLAISWESCGSLTDVGTKEKDVRVV